MPCAPSKSENYFLALRRGFLTKLRTMKRWRRKAIYELKFDLGLRVSKRPSIIYMSMMSSLPTCLSGKIWQDDIIGPLEDFTKVCKITHHLDKCLHAYTKVRTHISCGATQNAFFRTASSSLSSTYISSSLEWRIVMQVYTIVC